MPISTKLGINISVISLSYLLFLSISLLSEKRISFFNDRDHSTMWLIHQKTINISSWIMNKTVHVKEQYLFKALILQKKTVRFLQLKFYQGNWRIYHYTVNFLSINDMVLTSLGWVSDFIYMILSFSRTWFAKDFVVLIWLCRVISFVWRNIWLHVLMFVFVQ